MPKGGQEVGQPGRQAPVVARRPGQVSARRVRGAGHEIGGGQRQHDAQRQVTRAAGARRNGWPARPPRRRRDRRDARDRGCRAAPLPGDPVGDDRRQRRLVEVRHRLRQAPGDAGRAAPCPRCPSRASITMHRRGRGDQPRRPTAESGPGAVRQRAADRVEHQREDRADTGDQRRALRPCAPGRSARSAAAAGRVRRRRTCADSAPLAMPRLTSSRRNPARPPRARRDRGGGQSSACSRSPVRRR